MFKRLFGGDGGGGASSSKPLPSNVSQKAQVRCSHNSQHSAL
jgi:hypothetical protein